MTRRPDIDRARGLAILLVVFGHLVARADPAGVDWYEPLRRAVYAFHMPFFLYLSGLVAVLSGSLLRRGTAWPQFVKARAQRLLIPFFGLGLLITAGKLLAAHFLFVDNRPAGALAGFAELVWHTAASPALSIWYLFVLFVLGIAAPLVIHGDPRRIVWWLALSLAFYAVPWPAYVYLDHIGRYAIFFALGACAGLAGARWDDFVDRFWARLFVVFLLCLAAIAAFGAAWPVWLTLLPAGALSMPALHGLVRNHPVSSARLLLWLGRYGFVIYLFNTMFIGLAKGVLLRFTFWDAPHFAGFAAVLMLAGTLGPVALKRFGLRHVKSLDRLTD